jgi:hypothetical protein
MLVCPQPIFHSCPLSQARQLCTLPVYTYADTQDSLPFYRRYKAKYTIPLGVGATLTTGWLFQFSSAFRGTKSAIIVGFAFKVWASRETDNFAAWITSTILLFVAPPIYAAADYFIFAKTLHYVPSCAPMNPSRVVTTFVAADGLCEMLNSTGVGQIVNYTNPVKVRIGSALIKVCLLAP